MKLILILMTFFVTFNSYAAENCLVLPEDDAGKMFDILMGLPIDHLGTECSSISLYSQATMQTQLGTLSYPSNSVTPPISIYLIELAIAKLKLHLGKMPENWPYFCPSSLGSPENILELLSPLEPDEMRLCNYIELLISREKIAILPASKKRDDVIAKIKMANTLKDQPAFCPRTYSMNEEQVLNSINSATPDRLKLCNEVSLKNSKKDLRQMKLSEQVRQALSKIETAIKLLRNQPTFCPRSEWDDKDILEVAAAADSTLLRLCSTLELKGSQKSIESLVESDAKKQALSNIQKALNP